MAGDESRLDPMTRWHRRVSIDSASGCWIWAGHLTKGYGAIRIGGGRRVGAHVFAWTEVAGRSIPEGHELDHLCRVPRCVNPDHLEPVVHRVNLMRGMSPAARQARQTKCARGHALSGSNLRRRRNGKRECRSCALDTRRRHRRDNREQINARKRELYRQSRAVSVAAGGG